jgi:hypothetical protein
MTKADAAGSSGVPETISKNPADSAGTAGSGDRAIPEVAKAPAGEPAGGDDHLAAVTSLSSEALSNIDTTLDQLTTATDLFDIPAFDLDA